MKHKFFIAAKIVVYILGAGISLALPFIHYRAGWLSIVALLPLLFGLEWLEGLTWKRWHKVAVLYGVGLVFFGIIVQWMYHIRATDLIADSALRMTFVILSFLLVASSLALGFIVFGWLNVWVRLYLDKIISFAEYVLVFFGYSFCLFFVAGKYGF
jgi:apolipoprotein N-acyltransferase